MDQSEWALAFAYWLHMLATVAWLGGLSATALLVIPAARKTLNESDAALLGRVQQRLQRVGWLSLAILFGTGLFQMSASPSYEGFLAISNSWSVAIFAKHIVIVVMIGASIYITWVLNPKLQRLALLQAAGKEVGPQQSSALRQQENTLLWVNLVLSILVLLLTALARTG